MDTVMTSEEIGKKIKENKSGQHSKMGRIALFGIAAAYFFGAVLNDISMGNIGGTLFEAVVCVIDTLACNCYISEYKKLIAEETCLKFEQIREQVEIDAMTKDTVIHEGTLITEIYYKNNNKYAGSSVIDNIRKIEIAEKINPYDGTKLHQWVDLETGKIEKITENILSMTEDKLYDEQDQHEINVKGWKSGELQIAEFSNAPYIEEVPVLL